MYYIKTRDHTFTARTRAGMFTIVRDLGREGVKSYTVTCDGLSCDEYTQELCLDAFQDGALAAAEEGV